MPSTSLRPRFDSTYGPVGISPLEKERQLFPSDYLRLMAAGALAGVVRTEDSRDAFVEWGDVHC